jgi:N-acetylneuraminic acid mutarotase
MDRRHVALIVFVAVLIGLAALAPRANAAMSSGWQIVKTEDAPPPRYDHMLIAADGFNRLVLFGGRTADNETLGDTWIFDPATNLWREVTPAGSPMARLGSAIAYDALRKRIIMFGGFANRQIRNVNDTWAFDVEKETWSKIETMGTAPVPRYGLSGVIDPVADRFVISHGFADTRYDDTFALDLKTNTWIDVSPDTRPLKRCLHEAIYDTNNQKMILFGGCSSGFGPCPQGDLWSYDAAAKTWTELKPRGAAPSPRSNPALVFDPAGTLWLFGGRLEKGFNDELWSFDPRSNTWTQHSISGGPSARASHDAVWDAANKRLIVFGGQSDQGALNDLWVYTP